MDPSVKNLHSNPGFDKYFLLDPKENIQLLGINVSLEKYESYRGIYSLVRGRIHVL